MQYAIKQTAVSEQRLGKQVHAETSMHATLKQRCFRCGQRRGVMQKTTGTIQFSWGLEVQLSSAREAVKRRWSSLVESWKSGCEENTSSCKSTAVKRRLLTLKTLIYEGTNRMKPLVTEFVT
jgi:ribosomal protein S14